MLLTLVLFERTVQVEYAWIKEFTSVFEVMFIGKMDNGPTNNQTTQT